MWSSAALYRVSQSKVRLGVLLSTAGIMMIINSEYWNKMKPQASTETAPGLNTPLSKTMNTFRYVFSITRLKLHLETRPEETRCVSQSDTEFFLAQ